GDYDPETGLHTIYSPTQGAVRIQNGLSGLIFDLPKEKVRVVSYDVGGAFGLRGKLFAESILVVWAARRLKRPVKWYGDRSETFVSDCHGRDHVTKCRMALDADARILGVKIDNIANLGAYLSDMGPRIPTVAGA